MLDRFGGAESPVPQGECDDDDFSIPGGPRVGPVRSLPDLRGRPGLGPGETPGTYRALSLQIEGQELPDGSVVDVVFMDDGKLSVLYPGVYYSPAVRAVQDAGRSAVRAGLASLSLPDGNPSVPLFGKNGGIQVIVTDALGNVAVLATGSYAALGGP